LAVSVFFHGNCVVVGGGARYGVRSCVVGSWFTVVQMMCGCTTIHVAIGV
jgi:hypothetical protein